MKAEDMLKKMHMLLRRPLYGYPAMVGTLFIGANVSLLLWDGWNPLKIFLTFLPFYYLASLGWFFLFFQLQTIKAISA